MRLTLIFMRFVRGFPFSTSTTPPPSHLPRLLDGCCDRLRGFVVAAYLFGMCATSPPPSTLGTPSLSTSSRLHGSTYKALFVRVRQAMCNFFAATNDITRARCRVDGENENVQIDIPHSISHNMAGIFVRKRLAQMEFWILNETCLRKKMRCQKIPLRSCSNEENLSSMPSRNIVCRGKFVSTRRRRTLSLGHQRCGVSISVSAACPIN